MELWSAKMGVLDAVQLRIPLIMEADYFLPPI